MYAAAYADRPFPSPFVVDEGGFDEPVEAHGVSFVRRLNVEGTPLDLYSTGLMRYKRVLKGFVAALYLEDGTSAPHVLTNVPKRLELSYFWAISGRMFARAGREALRRSVGRRGVAALEARLRELDAAYRDVRPGDRYSLTYMPGRGTELALNGRSLVVIPGADFAEAYFGIWLGPKSIDSGLRRQLSRKR